MLTVQDEKEETQDDHKHYKDDDHFTGRLLFMLLAVGIIVLLVKYL